MDENSITIYHLSWTKTREGKPKLRLFVTDADGYKAPAVYLDLPVPPYMYAVKDIVEQKGLPPQFRTELVDTANYGKVYKVITSEPSDVPGLREFYGVKNCFEADVPYGRRVLIDRDLTVSLPHRRLYIDIETDPREGVPDEIEAKKRILSIAAVDQDGNEYFFSDEDEIAMIGQFLVLMDRYPVICTWYGGRFDWPYLQNRCQRLELKVFWESFVHVDLLVVYRDVMQIKREHYDLEFIADTEELPHRKSGVTIGELWDSFVGDKSKLRDRNIIDAHIIRDLDIKLTPTTIIFDIAKVTHTSVKDLLRINEKNTKDWNPSIAIDGLNLFLSGRRTPPVIWPSKEFKEDAKKQKQFTGALVLPPVPGVHHNVIALDSKSLYPSIIRTLNVGLETFKSDGSGDNKAPIGSFISEPESIMAESIRYVTELRERYRREKDACEPNSSEYKAAFSKEYAMKVVNNSVYGVSGSTRSRYFSKDIAENITLTGRRILAFLKSELEGMGYPVILGDTDSTFYVVPDTEDPIENAKFMSVFLTERVKDFLVDEFHPKNIVFVIKAEKVLSSLFIPSKTDAEEGEEGVKKRYAGLVTWEGKPTFYMMKKGFDMVRHDSSKAQKRVQEEMLLMKLTGATMDEQIATANEWKRKLFIGELNEDVVIWKGLNKKLEDYKAVPPQLRVARMLMETGTLQFHKGDKISYVKTGNKPEQVRPVIEGEPIVLTEAELAYIFDAQFKRIFDRLDIPVESERQKYAAPRRPRKAKTCPFKVNDRVVFVDSSLPSMVDSRGTVKAIVDVDMVNVNFDDGTPFAVGVKQIRLATKEEMDVQVGTRCNICNKLLPDNEVCPDCGAEFCLDCYSSEQHGCINDNSTKT